MADNSTMGNTTDVIASDDIGGVKHQRMKVEYGPDGSATDVSLTTPLPAVLPDDTTTGTITATDAVVGVHAGAGALLTGTPTANSYVFLALSNGRSNWTAQFTGTFGSGTVWIEVSADSTNGINGSWTTALGRMSGSNVTTLDESITAAGLFRGNASGMAYLRFRVTGATTPSVAIVARSGAGVGAMFLNAGLPPGTNAIGSIRDLGAASIAIARVTPTTTAATLVAARTTRRRLLITNNSNVTVYVGPATVTTANGYPVPVGSTLTLQTVALVQAIIATGTASADVACVEEYD